MSFIRKPALILPIDAPLTIGVLPLATAAIPPPTSVITTNISTGSIATSAGLGASPPPPSHRTFDLADRLSGFSLFSDRFFPKKRGLTNFTDDTGTGGSTDPKSRSGKQNLFI